MYGLNNKGIVAILVAFGYVAQADAVVDFNASTQVTNNSSNIGIDFGLNTSIPILTADGVNYIGADIYGGMNERNKGIWTVTTESSSGLRVRMNDSTANGVDGLFSFKANGVSFYAGNDQLSVSEIYCSAIQRLDSAMIRFVVEDAGQFYISAPSDNFVQGGSGGQTNSFSIKALSTNWFAYDPSTAAGISVIGAAASPAFADIDFIGFTLFADGVSSEGGAVNFGVRTFAASARVEAPELEVPVWEGIDGCVFQLDAREHYRFSIDSSDNTVVRWDGVYGVGAVHTSASKHPLYVENGFNGINVLDLPADRFLRCVFDAPVNEFKVFVVYWPDSAGQEVLIDNPDFEVELLTSTNAAPLITVGTASDLDGMDRLFLGKAYSGRVAEVVVFDHVLSVEEEQLVYDRLNVKWIERVSRDIPNLFKTVLGKTDAEFAVARAFVSDHMLNGAFETGANFRGDPNNIFRTDDSTGEVASLHEVEWLETILLGENDKVRFDEGLNQFEDHHWRWDSVVGQWYFYDTVYETGEEYRSTYVGQGNHYGMASTLHRAYAKWREPRYLELADRHASFWQAFKAFEDPTTDHEMIYSTNNAAGYGRGIIKMFRSYSLGLDAYTECTYMKPLGHRLAVEYGASVDTEFYDFAPHAQIKWLLRSSHPVTGLVPATSDLQGNPVEHKDERWARYSNDPTEKVWDRFVNSQMNYPQDMDAGLLESLNKVAVWADGIGVDNLLNDYELDGTRDNPSSTYKSGGATEGAIASIAALAQVVDTDLTPWIQQAWDDTVNTPAKRIMKGYIRSFFTISGLAQIQNDGLRKNYVSNPGLETPADLSGWDVSVAFGSVATNAARRGSYGISCTHQSPSPELDASAFRAGATYRYRAWVRSASGPQTVNVQCALDASLSISEAWDITSDWRLLEYTFRLPSEETISSLRIWVQSDPTVSFELDDVSVVLMSAPAVMPEPMNIDVTPMSLWNSWIAEYPGLGDFTNFADHADNDRFDNLTEYAWGGDPSVGGDTGNAPVQSQKSDGTTNYLEYVFYQRADAAERGLTSSLDIGTNLTETNWVDASSYEVGSGASGISGFNAVTNWIPTDAEGKQFIRLRIQLAE